MRKLALFSDALISIKTQLSLAGETPEAQEKVPLFKKHMIFTRTLRMAWNISQRYRG